jgi:hypothetical protein
MHFGVDMFPRDILTTRDAYKTIAQSAEALGCDFLSVSDHVIVPRSQNSDYPYSERRKVGWRRIRILLRDADRDDVPGCLYGTHQGLVIDNGRSTAPRYTDGKDSFINGCVVEWPGPFGHWCWLVARGVRN